MYSVDFAEIEPLQHAGRWSEATDRLVAAARAVERAGADLLVLCTNTMHKIADEIERRIQIPLLHIVDTTAEEVKVRGLSTVGLLGTRFTMEEDFFKGRLSRKHGLQVLTPPESDRKIVHRIIYDELCRGEIRQASKDEYVRIMQDFVRQGAVGIILGCTEIGLLISEQDAPVYVFDTTRIHAVAAAAYALEL
jgi:aspartate racemase